MSLTIEKFLPSSPNKLSMIIFFLEQGQSGIMHFSMIPFDMFLLNQCSHSLMFTDIFWSFLAIPPASSIRRWLSILFPICHTNIVIVIKRVILHLSQICMKLATKDILAFVFEHVYKRGKVLLKRGGPMGRDFLIGRLGFASILG